MKLLFPLLVWTSTLQGLVAGRAVFAHFMVSNTVGYTVANWANEIRLAQEAHIDAFALNMARDEKTTVDQLGNAFQAANNQGFKLFFSFDYAGNAAWGPNDVIALISKYAVNGAYYYRGTQPLVSTFEGPGNSPDWVTIKAKTGCFFIPDWSSRGAKDALRLGTADGLFNWGAWPEGPNDLFNTIDASYTYYLGLSKLTAYMMPASPWFYTNLPCFDKNWLWRGGSLWYDRWQSIWIEQPEFVQIISWNDFGESHYIGPLPLYDAGYEAFTRGQAPFNYVKNMPHDGWRAFLPFLIDVYKSGTASITREGVQAWYRLQPASACGNGGTTGNTGSQLQTEYNPALILTDTIFFSALLTSYADVSVTVGGAAIPSSWSKKPSNGIGVYHGSVAFGSRTGAVVVRITRNGAFIAEMTGAAITTTCQNGLTNWNAWTGSSMSTAATSGSPPLLSAQVCVAGKGVGNLAGLCSYSCERGYCPPTSCTCTQKGLTAIKPVYLVPTVYGCPLPSLDAQYEGLCSFTCGTGYCPPGACFGSSTKTTCATTPAKDPPIPAASPAKPRPATCPLPVDPNTGLSSCNRGTISPGVDANFLGLCDFSCNHGFCPKPCMCTQNGDAVVTPKDSTIGCPAPGYTTVLEYFGLCAYTCARGYCPSGACVKSTTACQTIIALPNTEDTPWMNVKCDNPVLTSVVLYNGKERWDASLAQKAWGAARANFSSIKSSYKMNSMGNPNSPGLLSNYYGPGKQKQFSQIVADYFHAPEGKQCQNVPDINCDITVPCGQSPVANGAVNCPAGQLIMNSFAGIHVSIDNLDTAIESARSTSFGSSVQAVAIMTSFADSAKALIALDTILLVFSLIGAVGWGQGLRSYKPTNGIEKSVMEDTVAAFVVYGINIAKDLVPNTSELNAIANFQSLANAMCTVMKTANAKFANLLFSGTDDGLLKLEGLITDGKSLDISQPNPFQIGKDVQAAIAATLLPFLWAANSGGKPFILTADLPQGTNCDVKNPPKMSILTDKERLDSYVCIDNAECTGGIAGLKGIERLNIATLGTENEVFGGLTRDALVLSSLRSKAKNSNQNGWKSADPTDRQTILDLVDQGASAAGVFNAPICGHVEASANVDKSRGGLSPNYPCN